MKLIARAYLVFLVLCALLLVAGIVAARADVIPATPADYAAKWAALKPGDTLLLGAGEYAPLKRSGPAGTAAARITVKAETPGKVIVVGYGVGLYSGKRNAWDLNRCDFYTFEGITFTKGTVGLYVGTSKGVQVRGNRFTANGTGALLGSCADASVESNEFGDSSIEHHLYASTCPNPTIRNNLFYRARKTAIQLNNSGASSPLPAGLIENNRMFTCGTTFTATQPSTAAINFLGPISGGVIRGNSIYGCLANGITLAYNVGGVTVEGNFIGFHPKQGGRCIIAIKGAVPNTSRNNLFMMGWPAKLPIDGGGITSEGDAMVAFPVVPVEVGQ